MCQWPTALYHKYMYQGLCVLFYCEIQQASCSDVTVTQNVFFVNSNYSDLENSHKLGPSAYKLT